MKNVKNILLTCTLILGLLFSFVYSKPVWAEDYTDGSFVVAENTGIITVTDQSTGLSASLDMNTGMLTDIDGSVSYVQVNNDYADNISIPSYNSNYSVQATTSGFKRGVWNYVTTVTYNLGYVQSVQAAMLKLIAVVSGPVKPFVNGAAGTLGLAAAVNKNVTVKLSQYYDPAQPTKIKEVVTTYANGRQIGSTSYVRNIY